MKHVSIDTNILVKAFDAQECDHRFVAELAAQRKIGIALDDTKVIEGEYRKEVGSTQGFQKWWQRLFQVSAFKWVSGKLDQSHCTKLKCFNCHEPSDHVFIAVAHKTDRILITEDGDFGKGPKGNKSPHDQALAYIQNTIGIKVLDAVEACKELSG